MDEIEILDIFQLFALADEEDRKEQTERRKRNLVRYDPQVNCFYLNRGGYWIPEDRIKDPVDFFKFILHVRGKTWFSPQLLSDLVDEWIQVFKPKDF